MNDNGAPDLTPRQREVIELLSERASHKEIAHRLGISVGRVGQYVRALKDRYGVQTLSQIVAAYRAHEADLEQPSTPYSFSTSREFKLPPSFPVEHLAGGAEVERLRFEDSVGLWSNDWPSLQTAEAQRSDRLVPKVLDGSHGSLYRVGYMLAVALGTLLVVLTGITMAAALSDLFLSWG